MPVPYSHLLALFLEKRFGSVNTKLVSKVTL